MKYIIVCLVALALCNSPADAFLSSIVSGLNNLVGSVVDTVNSGIDSITNTINTVTLVSQFLWDNALNPSLTVLQQNGADFIDNYFGTILNALGKRSDLESTLALKQSILSVYLTQTTNLIQSLKGVVNAFFSDLISTLKASALSIISGQTTIKQVITAVFEKYRDEVTKLVKDALQIILQQIHSSKETGLELLAAQIGNSVLAIGNLVNASLNAALSSIFAQITQG